MKIQQSLMYWAKVVSLGVIVGVGFQVASAWVAPTQTPPNGNIGLRTYVSDCNQFATGGWASKDECLKDGRWHLVQSTMGGANADLQAAMLQGAAEIRIGYTGAHGGWSVRMCHTSFIYRAQNGTSYAYCQGNFQYGGSVDDAIPANDGNTWYDENAMWAFRGSDPRAQETWGSAGVSITRSDGRTRGTSLVPQNEPNTTAKVDANLMVKNGSVSNLVWYARY